MWNSLRLFDIVRRAGSFTAAAKEARLSAVSIARQIGQLEAELGVVLFLRGAAGVTLTEAAQRLQTRIAPALDQMREAEAEACRIGNIVPATPVRVSATEPVIAELLAPSLPLLQRMAPELPVDLRVADAVVNLSRHEAEVAVRLARPEGDSLKLCRLARIGMGLYRSPAAPDTPESAPVIGYDDKYGEIAERLWLRQTGLEARVRLRLSSTRGILQAVRAGAGWAILPDFLAQPDLQPVAGYPPIPSRDIWMLAHRDVARRPEVRLVMRWVLAACRAAMKR
jgi:DNA-binding transcriptional LysR family regulator